ncbi:hypothetical protein AtEden1_Chr3g0187761 [Arabidopsis thaliana]
MVHVFSRKAWRCVWHMIQSLDPKVSNVSACVYFLWALVSGDILVFTRFVIQYIIYVSNTNSSDIKKKKVHEPKPHMTVCKNTIMCNFKCRYAQNNTTTTTTDSSS